MRSCCGGGAEDNVQIKMSTDVTISATIRRPPPAACHTPHATRHTPHATRHTPPSQHSPPYATCLSPPGAWRLQLSKSLDRARRSIHRRILSSEIGSVLPLDSVLGSVEPSRLGVCHRVQLGAYWRACSGVCLRAYLGVYLRATRRCTWERAMKCI